MTRAERLARQAAHAEFVAEQARKRAAQLRMMQREAEQKAFSRRCLFVGKLAHEVGLLALDDATLVGLFQALAGLVDGPDPVARLQALLHDDASPPPSSPPSAA